MGDPGNYEFLFSLMYTLYSAPNVILPFFGGYFVDLFGVRLCLLIFASLIAVVGYLKSLKEEVRHKSFECSSKFKTSPVLE
jgi:MFS family permease